MRTFFAEIGRRNRIWILFFANENNETLVQPKWCFKRENEETILCKGNQELKFKKRFCAFINKESNLKVIGKLIRGSWKMFFVHQFFSSIDSKSWKLENCLNEVLKSRFLSECNSSWWNESHDLFKFISHSRRDCVFKIPATKKNNSNQEISSKIPCRAVEKSHEKNQENIPQQVLCGWNEI